MATKSIQQQSSGRVSTHRLPARSRRGTPRQPSLSVSWAAALAAPLLTSDGRAAQWATSPLLPVQRQLFAGQAAQWQGNSHLTHALLTQRRLHFQLAPAAEHMLQRQVATDADPALRQAISGGVLNETRLTDLLFFQRHPERNQRAIDPQSEPALVQEWLAIRNQEVRPALASAQSPAAASAAGAAEGGEVTPALANGVRDETRLTNELFFARHPERNGRSIDPRREPHLAQEWVAIRNNEVRPALAQPAELAPPAALPQQKSEESAHAPVVDRPVAPPTPQPAPTPQPSTAEVVAASNHDRVRQLEHLLHTLAEMQRTAETPPPEQASAQVQNRWWQSTWQKMDDTSRFGLYKEAGEATVQRMAALLHAARALVNSLSAEDLQIDPQMLTRVKGDYHRQLNAFTPYYTQMANLNLLWLNAEKHYDAWMRTCNLTSLAMTLEAAGISSQDFSGDQALLTQIAQQYESRFQRFADLEALRMPDFLQLAVIYLKLPQASGADFEQRVDDARRQAAPLISTTLDIFAQVAALFGVARAHTGYIQSTGQQARAGNDGVVGVEAYKQSVQRQLAPWLDAGGQVVVNQPGHYVRLENIDDAGIVVDDPASKGKNYHVNWPDANRIGYFRSYQVFVKK